MSIIKRDGTLKRSSSLRACVCAVGARMSELRRNGVEIEKKYKDRHFEYRLKGESYETTA